MENFEYGDPELSLNYKNLKDKLSKAISESARTTELRHAKDILILAQAEFKTVKLAREDREELYNMLQQAFEKVNRQMEDQRQAFEHESFQNYANLKFKLDEVIYQAGKAPDWREAKKYLIEVQQDFRGLKLVKEQREELYGRLQAAFVEVNQRQEEEFGRFNEEAGTNYEKFKPVVEHALLEAMNGANYKETWDLLINVQNEFRQVKLLKEQRDELYDMLQKAFATLKLKREEENEKFHDIAEHNYGSFSARVRQIREMASNSTDFKATREMLKQTQAELRDSQIFREQKDELYAILQEAFTVLNLRQDEERTAFEMEAAGNYERLKKIVDKGLQQANDSLEYKETREFLKKIQAEFRGIRMIREQREELYSRLQSAFDTLQHRMDTFFREKKKNWEVYMQFKVKDFEVMISEIMQEIEKDEDHLSGLETQLDIMGDNPNSAARETLSANIQSLKNAIRKKGEKLLETEKEMENLKKRLGDDAG